MGSWVIKINRWWTGFIIWCWVFVYKSVKYMKNRTFFTVCLASQCQLLGHWRRGNLTHQMLITMLLLFRPTGHRGLSNKVGSRSRNEHPVEFEPVPFRFKRNALTHCAIHPKLLIICTYYWLYYHCTYYLLCYCWQESALFCQS